MPPSTAPPRPPPPSSSSGSKAPWHGADLSVLDKEQFFDELKQLYRKKVLPLELASKYAQFHSAPLNPADFDAKVCIYVFIYLNPSVSPSARHFRLSVRPSFPSLRP